MRAVFFCLLATVAARTADAACGCDHTVASYSGAGIQTIDGTALGVMPGQTVCLTSGARTAVFLNNMFGSSTKPITIKNCGGLVDIVDPSNAGLAIYGTNFRLTGTGDASVANGIRVKSTASGDNAIQVVNISSDYELDHLEVAGASYAGVMAKVDPRGNCDPTVTRPVVAGDYTMKNVRFHDLDIHDTGGEGMYLGDSFYLGTAQFNSNTPGCPSGQLQYPHELRSVYVYGNRLKNTGREAIQVGAGVQDIQIYGNRVELYGQGNLAEQNAGIQLGVGTTGRLYDNLLLGGPGDGITVQGIGEDYVYDNIIVNCGGYAVTVNVRPTPLTTDIVSQNFLGGTYVMNNTIVDNHDSGVIIEYINAAPKNVFFNNLIVSGAAKWNQLQTTTDWTVANNVVVTTVAAGGFVDAANGNYHLLPTSPALAAGRNLASYGLTADYDGVARPTTPTAGAYEYVAGAPVDAGVAHDAAVADLTPMTPPDFSGVDLFGVDLQSISVDLSSPAQATADLATNSDGGQPAGCGCDVGARPSNAWGGVAIVGLLIWISRRRKSEFLRRD